MTKLEQYKLMFEEKEDALRQHFWISVIVTVIGIVVLFSFMLVNARAETASYYTYQSCIREGTSGVWTASGERFNENDLTCAMRSRNFGKYYKITNLENGKSVIVKHNDYGPNKKLWKQGRIVDLSKGAFQKISSLKKGIIRVKVEAL